MSAAFLRKLVLRCDAGVARIGAWRVRGGSTAISAVESASDAAMARLAASQHGVVGRRQLRQMGFGGDAIDRRVALGRLHPLHRGVYALGHPRISRHGTWMAAVLAGRPERGAEPPRRCGALADPRDTPLHARRHRSAARRPARDQRAPDRAPARRGHRPPRDPGHDAGPHPPRPRRDADPAPARSGDHGGGDQPPRKPHLPRRPGRAPPEGAGDREPAPDPPQLRRHRPHGDPLRPRDRVPRLPRRPRSRARARTPSSRSHSRSAVPALTSCGRGTATAAPRSPPSSARSSPSRRPQHSRNRRTGR